MNKLYALLLTFSLIGLGGCGTGPGKVNEEEITQDEADDQSIDTVDDFRDSITLDSIGKINLASPGMDSINHH